MFHFFQAKIFRTWDKIGGLGLFFWGCGLELAPQSCAKPAYVIKQDAGWGSGMPT
jgi:hypothetical protein